MRKPLHAVLALLAALFAVSRSTPGQPAAPSTGGGAALRVVVSIPPLKGLVAPLLPEGSRVDVLCPPGRSEHGFELTPGMVAALAEADLVALVGMGLEPQVERALEAGAGRAPGRRIVRFADAVGVGAGATHTHDHAHDAGDGHADEDPHLWLDPALAGKFAASLEGDLLEVFRERGGLSAQQTAEFKMRRSSFLRRVQRIEAEYADALAPHKGAAIITHHPAFGRLAARFGLEVAATLRATDTGEPTPGSIAEVVRLVRERRIGAIFSEPQSDPALARRVAEAAGVRVLPLDPLGDGDWEALMRSNLRSLVEGLAGAPPAP